MDSGKLVQQIEHLVGHVFIDSALIGGSEGGTHITILTLDLGRRCAVFRLHVLIASQVQFAPCAPLKPGREP